MHERDEYELTKLASLDIGNGTPDQSGKLRIDRRKNHPNKFWLQLKLLLWKNYLVQKRSPRSLLLQMIMPFIVCLIITEWQKIASDVTKSIEIESPIKTIGNIPKCYYTIDDPDNCVSIEYGIIGESEPWIHSVMDYVGTMNGFEKGKDINYLGETTPKEFSKHLMNNLNKTQLGVIFCTSAWTIRDIAEIPCKLETQIDKKLVMYNILYNISEFLKPPVGDDFRIAHPKHPHAASLKLSLDNAIVAYFSEDQDGKGDKEIDLSKISHRLPKMKVDYQDYPKTHFRFLIGGDVINLFGCLQFAIPFMLNFLITSFEIVQEKNKRLREGLSTMGMSATAYWFSWAVTCLFSNTLITLITILAGYLFRFPFFIDTPVYVLFMMFFGFGLALQASAFWIATLSATATTAYVLSYGVLLVCVVLTLFVNSMGISYLLYKHEQPKWFAPIRMLFELSPAFEYSVTYGNIVMRSGNHYDYNQHLWVKGPGFKFEDFFIDDAGEFPAFGHYSIPSCWTMFKLLLRNAIGCLILTWYCDNVIGHNRGTPNSPFFFLTRKYWSKLAHDATDKANEVYSPKKHANVHNDYNYNNMQVEDSVDAERKRVIQNQQLGANCKGLRIMGINKIYRTSMFGWASSKDIHAVKDVYLEVEDGELLSLLGHNGAGKTTLIGVLTGLSQPTTGTAEMYNYDINQDMDCIRQIMGVCPQFDILWNELTAAEHLHIFAKLKGLPEHQIPSETQKRLSEVNLTSVTYAQTGTYSGGMKRRLSMAIAFIGDPKIVFLDEPTTGMDPKNRRHVWELIQKMKKGRVVILTTHAMEEADALSDRIAVVSHGTLKCVGTGLYLKNTYGDGYRLSLVVEKDDVDFVRYEIMRLIPSGKILDWSGGNILVGVPLLNVEELKTFFKIMENKNAGVEAKEFKNKVKDWGLSNTTLEEVFMKITNSGKLE